MIRQAHPQDREGVLATVTAAFAQDPGWAFLMGGEYERLAPEFVGALFDLRAPGQERLGQRRPGERRDVGKPERR